MKISSKTDVGRVRDTNQDSYATIQLSNGVTAVIVCDGMGGTNGGNIASDAAVRIISYHINNSSREGMSSKSIKSMLKSAIYAANISIFDLAKSNESLSGMGTTVVVAIILNGVVHIAHAGDSRAYLIKDLSKIEQLTRDHSIVQHMLESGQLTPDEARFHPKRNVITRALGVAETIDFDYDEVELSKDDLLLICTDGLTNYLGSDNIIDILNNSEFHSYADDLVSYANKNGGGDNITVVVVAD